jgi:hypothetical protein
LAKLWKILQKGLTALRRSGSVHRQPEGFDPVAWSNGQAGRGAKVILDALESASGRRWCGEATGLTGATNRLSDAWGNLLEDIGQTSVVAGCRARRIEWPIVCASKACAILMKEDPIGKQLVDAQNAIWPNKKSGLKRLQNYKPSCRSRI